MGAFLSTTFVLKEEGVIIPSLTQGTLEKGNGASAQCRLKGISVKAVQSHDTGESPDLRSLGLLEV